MNLRHLIFRNRIRSFRNSSSAKNLIQWTIFLFFLGLVLFMIYFGTISLLNKLDTLNGTQNYGAALNLASSMISVGDLIKERLLSMVILSIFFMLLFSNTISSISHVFLSKDTELLIASPISPYQVFQIRFFEAGFSSSWMSFFFFFPVLFAYLKNYHVSYFALIPFFLALIPFLMIPASLGVSFALVTARYFPIKQSKRVFQFMSVFFLTAILILLRVLQPEKLFQINGVNEIHTFINNLQIPFYKHLPSTWLSKIAISSFTNQSQNLYEPAILLFSLGFILLICVNLLGKAFFFTAWCKSKENSSQGVIESNTKSTSFYKSLPLFMNPIHKKDFILFFRNPELWSQIFLIFAMVGLYLYNINLLHLDKLSIYNVARFISFLNVAFVGFITTSISMRFLFPSISLEGPAFWILKSSPFSMSDLLFKKFSFFTPIILIIGNLMTLLANYILQIPWWLYLINGINISILCIVNSLLAISFGALFPNYRAENLNKIFMSFGGTFYMIASLSFMFLFLGSQGYPIYILYKHLVRHNIVTNYQILGVCTSIIIGFITLYLFSVLPYQKAKRALISHQDGCI
ncbi:MAG: hypothetical protein COB02_06895 [Candidatus Cloacimonadota bacterium]|nr:MAG: hypothetical protein COB02_06895 [Candidatus Cloacimonadota bacterium]